MDANSARLALPFINVGQAQKELAHNEALTRLDLVVQASVASVGANVPPASPEPGHCDVVGPAPVGAWSGAADAIAGWTDGGWRFVSPREGMAVWSESDGVVVRYTAGAWRRGVVAANTVQIGGLQVVGPRQPAVAEPGGGATVDVEARAAIGAILDALRTHGLIAPSP